MSDPSYWLGLFTGTTWDEFKEAGSSVSGFRESRWATVQKIKPGDYLLCYLTGVSRFIGVLEVVSKTYKSDTVIWKDELFPCRIDVKPIVSLTPDTALPVLDMLDSLSFYQNAHSKIWTGPFRCSPSKWNANDGKIVYDALLSASANPVTRPVDHKKLLHRPRALTAKIGVVTVPEREEDSISQIELEEKKPTEHTEIQWLLLTLGTGMGFEVWVARNDRGRSFDGNNFAEISRIKKELPLQFDDATNKTIELIDVLWLRGNAIIAAFEVESTTSIYSGLLRMADLIAMQPNLNIPLYLVAPDERRDKVSTEVNRPTFKRLEPPLSEICRFISFTTLKEKIHSISGILRFIKPEILEDISESCSLDEL